MKEEQLSRLLDTLNASPIRKLSKKYEGNNIFFQDEIMRTKEISKIIEINKENLTNPLKIVLMGEVKAGKSTLLNSLVGKEVSYMNVVEATASILEVKYGEEIKAVIQKKDGRQEVKYSIEELNAILDENRSKMEFFKEIEKIIVSMPLERLKEITIVDTPGLNTITIENAKKTENYILNSDVIIWVVNGHHLGQRDVSINLDEVRRLGKPIICAVNRIDEIDCDREELIEYIEGEMGYIFKSIFPISAREALKGVLEHNEERLKISGFNELNSYLLNNIERNSQNVQLDSIRESTLTQIKREVSAHKYLLLRLDQILKGIVIEANSIEKFNRTVMISVKDRINQWIDYEFFSEERNTLLQTNNLEGLLKEYFNEEYINSLVQEKYKDIASYIYTQWELYGDKLMQEKKEALNDKVSLDNIEKSLNLTNIASKNDVTVESCVNGATTAGVIGLGLAGYAAWFGPAAAYVSIGTAISAFMPPLLITGVIGGAVIGLLKKGKSEENKNAKKVNLIEDAINKLRKNLRENVKDNLINELQVMSNVYKNQLTQASQNILSEVDIKFDEAVKIIDDIYDYIEMLGKEIINLDFKEEIYLERNIHNYEMKYIEAVPIKVETSREVNNSRKDNYNNNKICTKLVGVTFNNRQSLIKKCYSGQVLNLERDVHNEYDKNAIKVLNGEEVLGHLSKEVASSIAYDIDNGDKYNCEVLKVTGGGSYNYGLNVIVTKENIVNSNNYNIEEEPYYYETNSYDDYDDYNYGKYYDYDYDDPENIIQRRYDNDPCDADPDMCCGYDH